MIISKRHRIVRYLGLLGLYSHSAKYGEKPLRPAILLLLVFIAGIMYWGLFSSLGHDNDISELFIPSVNLTTGIQNYSIITNVSQVEISGVTNSSIWTPVERTLINIVSLHDKPTIADLLIRIISLPALALLGITFRRKLERKYRH